MDTPTPAQAARLLRDDEMHVWRLAYRREQRRDPLQSVLGAYLDIRADDVALVAGEHGRPELSPAHDSSLGFNWSHSGESALIAIGRGITPGIDIEHRRPRPKALEIARRYFCEDEFAALAALPLDARSDAFLELWTAKEAVLKALGHGLVFGLHRLNIVSAQGQPALRWIDGDNPRAWQLHRLEIDRAYLAALAWRGTARQVRCWTLASPC